MSINPKLSLLFIEMAGMPSAEDFRLRRDAIRTIHLETDYDGDPDTEEHTEGVIDALDAMGFSLFPHEYWVTEDEDLAEFVYPFTPPEAPEIPQRKLSLVVDNSAQTL